MAVRARRKSKPFNPAGVTTYPSRKAFNNSVNSLARSQVQPTLNDISTRQREEAGAHKTRVGDISGYYNFDLNARQAAQTRLNEALTGILNRNDVLGSGASEGLAAALRASAAPQNAAAAQLGVAPGGTDPAIMGALGAYGKADTMGLAGDAAGALTRGAADLSIAGAAQREAGMNEEALNKANLTGLAKERTAAMGQLPGLRTQARQNLLQQILANSQNKLAWRQFGSSSDLAQQQQDLAESQFGETKKQNRAQNKLGRAQLKEQTRASKAGERQARANGRLEQKKLGLQRQQILADQGAAAAKQFDGAVEFLSSYLSPSDLDYKYNDDGKKVFDPKAYNKRISFDEALTQIMNRYGMDSLQAYQILGTASIPAWRKKAAAYAGGYQAGLAYQNNPAYSGSTGAR